MKIILDNIRYKGHYFKQFVCELPQLTDLKDVPEDRIYDYIKERLDEHIASRKNK